MNTHQATYQRWVKWTVMLAVGALSGSMLSRPVCATSTGLNNIPTADTPPHRTIVFQSFANVRDETLDDYFAGFKTGLEFDLHRIEWGLDGRMGEGGEEVVVLQGKYAVQPWDNLPALALGAANIAVTSDDRDEAGQAFKFILGTHDFGWVRGHAGFGFQHQNDAAFFGFDKTITFLDRDLMLRTDFIQIDGGNQWLASGGFIYFLHKHVAVESWVSQPLEHGEPTFTLKLNLIFGF